MLLIIVLTVLFRVEKRWNFLRLRDHHSDFTLFLLLLTRVHSESITQHYVEDSEICMIFNQNLLLNKRFRIYDQFKIVFTVPKNSLKIGKPHFKSKSSLKFSSRNSYRVWELKCRLKINPKLMCFPNRLLSGIIIFILSSIGHFQPRWNGKTVSIWKSRSSSQNLTRLLYSNATTAHVLFLTNCYASLEILLMMAR